MRRGHDDEAREKHTNTPIASVCAVSKYDDVVDTRMHKRYTPAVEEELSTVRVVAVNEPADEEILLTAEEGVPAQEAAAVVTKADESPLTLTSPAPLTPTVSGKALTGITDGIKDAS